MTCTKAGWSIIAFEWLPINLSTVLHSQAVGSPDKKVKPNADETQDKSNGETPQTLKNSKKQRNCTVKSKTIVPFQAKWHGYECLSEENKSTCGRYEAGIKVLNSMDCRCLKLYKIKHHVQAHYATYIFNDNNDYLYIVGEIGNNIVALERSNLTSEQM